MDVNILLSVINTKLRNEFSSISLLCASFEVDEKLLVIRLEKDGYVYKIEQNQFRKAIN